MKAEQTLLAAILKDRNCYEQFRRHGESEIFSGLGKLVLGAIDGFYAADRDIQSCDRHIISERIVRNLPNPKHATAFDAYFRDIPDECSVPNIVKDIIELKRERLSGELSLALANRSPQDIIQPLLEQYRSVSDGHAVDAGSGGSELIDPLDCTDLTEPNYDNEQYIKLWPRSLNDRLEGGALRGHHVLLFARPETGKTLFSINLVAGFLAQGLSVLYVGNEEPAADIRDRIRGRILKQSKSWVRTNHHEAAERLRGSSKGELRILETSSFGEVRSRLADVDDQQRPASTFRADVVLLDQVRNMRLKSEGRTAELEAAGIEARAIAKEFNVLVVSITQAGDSATGKVFLTMSDVDGSKTGLPASADLMIGLGQDPAMKLSGVLGVALCKNKLSGLHDNFTINCNYQTGVIE